MKTGFIRALWGIYDKSNRLLARRFRTDSDIARIKRNKFNEPFVTYIMGRDNYTAFESNGLDCKLVCEEPQVFDLIKYQYRNKIEIIKAAFEDGYDELVYLDWDCVPQKELPSDFWDVMRAKGKFQACLQVYRRQQCFWREFDRRKVPNGGFLYLGSKDIIDEAVRVWDETGRHVNDEITWAKMTDAMMGGWQGIDAYWNNFEPHFCNLYKSSPHSKDLLKSKNECFIHYQG